MNFVADESVDGPIIGALRTDGHDVRYIAETHAGAEDDVVLELANSTQSLLLTEDKDFGELVFRIGRVTFGVVLIRLAGLSASIKADQVTSAIRNHANEIKGMFSVISPGTIRIRKTN